MKVLLIQPPNGETVGLNSVFLAEPLALEMVAASLGPEHECSIIDMRLESDLDAVIKGFRPDACGISCSFTSDVKRTRWISAQIKSRLPGSFVFVGGHHASQRPFDFVGTGIDAVLVGDGEEACRNLLRSIERESAVEDAPGVLMCAKALEHGEIPKGTFPEMVDLPLPARSMVKKYRSQYQMGLEWPIYSVETARGCPYRCMFCSVWQFYGGKRRERPLATVVEDLSAIPGENIFFTDDLFFLDGKRAVALALEIKRAGIKKHYTCQARADGIVRDRSAVRFWKEIGLRRIFVGLESPSDAGLRTLDKGCTLQTNERALEILDELEVTISGQFIVEPEFSIKDFQALLNYVRRKRIAFPSFTILTPLPGTRLYEQRRAELVTEACEMFDLFHCVLPTKLPLESFYQEFARLYRECYFGGRLGFPTYRILRYFRSVEGARRFVATTKNLKKLCRAESYLKTHLSKDLDNQERPSKRKKDGE
jgi:radical SAM superfamily enzyme YgiQ (UPF0313 family)